MAKGRVISKSISTSRRVNLLLRNPLDCLLYTWGLVHADDSGRMDGHPGIFRAIVAPALPGLTDARVAKAITAMAKAHLLLPYTVQGVMVIQFLDWDAHQSFHGYARKTSKHPAPGKDILDEAEITLSGENHKILALSFDLKETKVKETKEEERLSFGEFGNVHMTRAEYNTLVGKLGEPFTKDRIAALDLYLGQTGKKYKSHYLTILAWLRKEGDTGKPPKPSRTFPCRVCGKESPNLSPVKGVGMCCYLDKGKQGEIAKLQGEGA